MIRNPIALVPYLLALAAVLGGLLSYAGDRVVSGASGTAAVGGAFALTDQDGEPKTDKDFHGRYLLVYFGFTHCPDVCPTTLTVMSEALAKLGPKAGRIAPVFITVDPGRDTPETLKNYLKAFDPRFTGLTGSTQDIAKVERAFRVYAARQDLAGGEYAMIHSNTIYLMGPNGEFIAYFDEAMGPEELAQELRKRV